MNDSQPVIGHVHLRVSDLERSVKFYTEALGFDVVTRMGDSAAFLSFGGYHHHLGLNTWHSRGGPPAPRNAAGLYHFAILYPDRASLARAVQRVLASGVSLDGASDHGVSEAIYLHDPDRNGIELYRDRPRGEWPHDTAGNLTMFTAPLDLEVLLKQA
jgi:catechol 2,3-dioxygenase